MGDLDKAFKWSIVFLVSIYLIIMWGYGFLKAG